MVAPPPILYLAGFLLGMVIGVLFPVPIWPGLWIRIVGILPLTAGIWLCFSAFKSLTRHKTPPQPNMPTVAIVQDGPYRFTRNPIYLGFSLLYAGASLIFNSLPALIVIIPVLIIIDRRQILREEAYLKGKFGDEYAAYKSKVRRWL